MRLQSCDPHVSITARELLPVDQTIEKGVWMSIKTPEFVPYGFQNKILFSKSKTQTEAARALVCSHHRFGREQKKSGCENIWQGVSSLMSDYNY